MRITGISRNTNKEKGEGSTLSLILSADDVQSLFMKSAHGSLRVFQFVRYLCVTKPPKVLHAAEKKEIVVSVDCPEDLTVFHDSKWTSEALFNLLDNAVKYTPAGGKIAVSVVLWEMYVEIKVADTGKGISESNQAAIFRRFYREEEVHEQQGVGIGLYLAREIVTRQGGYIKVVSEPGKGSEFSIMLPTK